MSMSTCHGTRNEVQGQGIERVYNKMKLAFRSHRQGDATMINDAIDHAIAVVNSIAVIAATATPTESKSASEITMYAWLVSRASIWRNPIMRDYVSIRYLAKQFAKHIDLMYSISISILSRPDTGVILFTETDRRMYLDMLEEYRQIIILL